MLLIGWLFIIVSIAGYPLGLWRTVWFRSAVLALMIAAYVAQQFGFFTWVKHATDA